MWGHVVNSPKEKTVKGVARTGPSATLNVLDAECTTDSVILGRTVTAGTPSGFWEIIVNNGSFDINSTASESGLTFNYTIRK